MPRTTIQSLKRTRMGLPTFPQIATREGREARRAQIKELFAPMGGDTSDWYEMSAAIDDLLWGTYLRDMQAAGAKIAQNIICAASGARVSDGETTYYHDRLVGATAFPATIYKTTRVTTTTQGRITGPGRMGGLGGWTLDKDAIAAALASFWHNWIATLIAFFDRASLPLTNRVTLPNIVLAETKEPKQLVVPLSTKFSRLPTPLLVTTVNISAPVKSSFWAEFWHSNKELAGKTDVIEIEAGTSEVVIHHSPDILETSGFFNIEPNDAPEGLVIESVDLFPPI